MPIETICETCNNRLRVADEHAGKLARCPKCQSVYTVPTPGTAAMTSGAANSPATGGNWRLKTADGMVYGPVPKSDMDRWLSEGRVTADSQLLEDGAEGWRMASQVYPQLAATAPHQPASPFAAGGGAAPGSPFGSTSNPFGPKPANSPFGQTASNPFSDAAASPNPYTAPRYAAMSGYTSRYMQPHRGVLVLVLGILGLSICGLIGMPAAFMGMADLREMNAGRMDPSGKGLTIAGMIMGWICVAIFALGMLIFVVSLIAGA